MLEKFMLTNVPEGVRRVNGHQDQSHILATQPLALRLSSATCHRALCFKAENQSPWAFKRDLLAQFVASAAQRRQPFSVYRHGHGNGSTVSKRKTRAPWLRRMLWLKDQPRKLASTDGGRMWLKFSGSVKSLNLNSFSGVSACSCRPGVWVRMCSADIGDYGLVKRKSAQGQKPVTETVESIWAQTILNLIFWSKKAEVEIAIRNGQGWIRILHIIYITYHIYYM